MKRNNSIMSKLVGQTLSTLFILGKCSYNGSSLLTSSKITFFQKKIRNYYESVKQLGSISGPTLSVLIWVETVCKCYQKMTKVAASK